MISESKQRFLLCLVLFFIVPVIGRGEEKPCESVIDSIGVFKNGIYVVHATLTLTSPGTWVLANPPKPIHGTFFIESTTPVTAQAAIRNVEVPLNQLDAINWSRDFAGHKVKVSFGDGEPVVGEFISTGERAGAINSLETPDATAYTPFSSRMTPGVSGESASSPLVFRKESGELLFLGRQSAVSSIEVLDSQKMQSVKRPQPVLLFTVPDDEPNTPKSPIIVRLTWLAKGITWAPSYRVDISNSEKLILEQTPVLINEALDLNNVEICLVSGFPQIPFGNVPSPIDPNISLANFFQSLSARRNQFDGNNAVTMQQAVLMNSVGPSIPYDSGNSDSASGTLAGDDLDTFYQSIGRRTIARGERLVLSIAQKETPWQKIVCWNIPDTRNERGEFISYEEQMRRTADSYGQTNSGSSTFDLYREPWDTIQFRNPFDFPLTTGPVSCFDSGKFRGQNIVYWCPSGGETQIGVNKALSITVSSKEEERTTPAAWTLPPGMMANQIENKDAMNPADMRIRLNGYYYRMATIDAVMTITNNRSEDVTMQMTRRFSGEPLVETISEESSSATGLPPQTVIRPRSSGGVNRQHERSWTLTLTPGQTRTIRFSYQVLIQQ